jgi:hypothetical protein
MVWLLQSRSLEVVHAEDSGMVSVALAEVAEEGMVRTVNSAVKIRMATGEEDMVPELEVRKAERGALGRPTREAVVVGIGKASLVMILRGRLEGTMSATAAQAAGMR